MADPRVLIDATNQTFWRITNYKPGQKLDMSDPSDRAMSKKWLDIYAQIRGRRERATRLAQSTLNETKAPYVLVVEQRDGTFHPQTFHGRHNLDAQYAWLIDQPDYYTYAALFDFTAYRAAPIVDEFAMPRRAQAAVAGL